LSALTHRRTILDPSKLEYLNKNHLMETWSQPDGLNALTNRVIGPLKEAFPDRYVCVYILPITPHSLPALASIRPRTTSNRLSWLYRYGAAFTRLNGCSPLHRAGLPTSLTSQESPLTSSSSPIMGHGRRNPWSSPFLRLTSVGAGMVTLGTFG